MKIIHPALAMIVAFVVMRAVPARAQVADTAPEHIAQAQTAFNKGDYKTALDHYEKAFALDSTPANALRVFVASTYVQELSVASKRLETWFTKKRSDAQKLGDNEESWKIIDTAATSLRGAASRQEAKAKQLADQIDMLNKKLAKLEGELQEQKVFVRSVKVGYEQQVENLKLTFQKQLELTNVLQQGTTSIKRE